jgi:thymidylate synthase
MNKLDLEYQYLVRYILESGVEKKDRTGTGTKSTFGWQIRHKMSDGFPLLTTKKVFWKGVVGELLWFLRGDTNIKWLVDNGIGIWTGDAYKKYTEHFIGHEDIPGQEWFEHEIKTNPEFSAKFGELGPIYGRTWRKWGSMYETNHILNTHTQRKPGIDQIANLIHDLKTNPDSRRLMVSAWNVGELDSMVLPPCHYGFQVYTRELSQEERYNWYINTHNKNLTRSSNQFDMDDVLNTNNTPTRAISLMWNQRSVDVGLGLPFNIASYGLLLEILAKATNMVPYELIGNLGDCHLYSNHIEPIQEQLTREPFNLPTLNINTEFWPTQSGECGVGELTDNVDSLIRNMEIGDFTLENYTAHPAIKLPLSN